MSGLLYPYYEKGRYYNWDKKKYSHYWYTIEMGVSQCLKRPLQTINAYRRVPIDNNSIAKYVCDAGQTPAVTWFGHSTFLIRIGNLNILTDPIFHDLPFPFPKRLVKSNAVISHLPPIDIVLVSHFHADHFDIKTLQELFIHHQPLFLVPLDVKQYFSIPMQERVHEKNWWQSTTLENVIATFLPAYHWSGNSLQTINKSLWGSWMISFNGFKIYFAGDTAHDIHFKCIAEQFSSIDLALLPFSACNREKEYSQILHLNPDGFLRACKDLRARLVVPMHWGTFSFYQDRFKSITILKNYWQKSGAVNSLFTVLEINETLHL